MTSRFTRGNRPKDDGNGKPNNDPFAKSDSKPDWPTHGAFSALRLYRERNLDLRRADHKFLFDWRESLVNDLGGPAEVNTFQLAMIDRSVELLIIISAMGFHIEKVGVMAGDELVPCLRSSYLQYVNSLRHTLSAAFEHSQKKPKTPNLRDYLTQNYPNPKEGNTDGRENSVPKEDDRSGQARTRHRYESDGGEQSGEGTG